MSVRVYKNVNTESGPNPPSQYPLDTHWWRVRHFPSWCGGLSSHHHPTVPASRLTQSTARTASQTRELSMICAKSLTVKHSGRSQEHGEDGYSTRNQALARHEWERIRKKEERRKGEGGDWQIWKRVEDRRKRNTNTLIQTASPTLVFYPRDAELIGVKHGPQVKSRPVSEI